MSWREWKISESFHIVFIFYFLRRVLCYDLKGKKAYFRKCIQKDTKECILLREKSHINHKSHMSCSRLCAVLTKLNNQFILNQGKTFQLTHNWKKVAVPLLQTAAQAAHTAAPSKQQTEGCLSGCLPPFFCLLVSSFSTVL
jgi:hypothetical protein